MFFKSIEPPLSPYCGIEVTANGAECQCINGSHLTLRLIVANFRAMKDENYKTLREFAARNGADLFGVADTNRVKDYIDAELSEQATRLPFAISIGIRLQRSVLNTIVNRPNQIYKTHYRQVNSLLDNITQLTAGLIQRRGFNAIPIAASFIVDWQKQNAHISHRHVAREAGVGFMGKNNLLIHPEYGAGVRLTSILTDLPLRTDSPIPEDCGECQACVVACPADAISDNGFDFDKCYEQVRKFAKENNYNLYLCGLCVKACANARGKTRR
jgi:epoxyqueuosine reductase